MKKLLSCILALLLVLTAVVPAFAAEESAEPSANRDYPLVIVRGMDFGGLSVNTGTPQEQSCLVAPGFGDIVKLVGNLAGTYFTEKTLDTDALIGFLDGMMGLMACDENGNSRYDVSYAKYPQAVSNYPLLQTEYEVNAQNEIGIVKSAVEHYGADNTYYFTYDWRLDPTDTADDLNTMIEQAKADHNAEKVDLVCCSMGGIVTDSYIYEYGCESLHNVVFDSSTFCGTYVTTELFQGKVLITEQMLYNFLGNFIQSDFVLKLFSKLGLFRFAANFAMDFIDKYQDVIYDEFLYDVFVTMPSLWALVQHDQYQACLDYMFPTEELRTQYAGLIARADHLQEMVAGLDEMLLSLPEHGVNVSVIAAYETQMIPVYPSAAYQSDGTLETALMLGRATVSETRSTLGDDYVADNPECLSPDRCIDTSHVLFPESTWAIRNASHVIGDYGSDLNDFLFWLLTYDGQPTVHSNPDYPRFMKSDSSEAIYYFE